MWKVEEGLVRNQLLDWYFLNAQDERALCEVLIEDSPCLFVLMIGKDPLFGGLNDERNMRMLGKNLLDVARSQWSSSLPYALVLATDTDQIFALHAQIYIITYLGKCMKSFILRTSSRVSIWQSRIEIDSIKSYGEAFAWECEDVGTESSEPV